MQVQVHDPNLKDNNSNNTRVKSQMKLFSKEDLVNNTYQYLKPIFIRKEEKYNAENACAHFKSLTIAFTTFEITNALKITGKIQVTGKSSFKADNCTFSFSSKYPLIEIFANSTAEFNNCVFLNCSLNTALLIRDRSICYLNNCIFIGNKDSLVSMDRSYVHCQQCKFYQSSNSAITVIKSSSAEVIDCTFSEGKIFVNEASKIQIYSSTFEKKGISTLNKSDCCLSDVKFSSIEGSAIRAVEESNIFAQNIEVSNVKNGNGICFENSAGYVFKSKFCDIDFPAVSVNGPLSNPIISHTSVKNVETFGATCRKSSCAKFEFCEFSNIQQNAFSFSDSSYPFVNKCVISNIIGSAFSVFDGAKPLIKNNIILECGKCAIDVFNYGKAVVFQNYINIDTKKYNIHRKGDIIVENLECKLSILREFCSELEPFNPPVINGVKLRFFTPPDDREVPKLDFFVSPDSLGEPILIQKVEIFIPKEDENENENEMKALVPCKHKVSQKCAEEITLKERGSCPLCQSIVNCVE